MLLDNGNLSDKEVINELAALTPLQYDRVRIEAAKILKVRPSTLDNIVKTARTPEQQDTASPFTKIEP